MKTKITLVNLFTVAITNTYITVFASTMVTAYIVDTKLKLITSMLTMAFIKILTRVRKKIKNFSKIKKLISQKK